MGLWMFVGRGRACHLAGLIIDIEVALRWAVDAVSPVQPGVEPLRRVRCGLLQRQHPAHFVKVGFGVGLFGKIAALPAPVSPSSSKPIKNLFRGGLAAGAFVFRQFGESLRIGFGTPEPLRHTRFAYAFQLCRDARFTKILLSKHVTRNL